MKKKDKLFLFIEILLYISFILLDFGSNHNLADKLKYCSIVLCCFWSIGEKDKHLQLAQFFVLGADFFLLFTKHFGIGTILFILVQLCYRAYIKNSIKNFLTAAAIGFILGIFIYSKIPHADWSILTAGIYGICLIQNTIQSILNKNTLFSIGIFLLLLCDINVTIYNLLPMSTDNLYSLYCFSSHAIWMFYLPSQVIIYFSSIKKRSLGKN